LIYQFYNDPFGKWTDVSKEEYDKWDGEKRTLEIVEMHLGPASNRSSKALYGIVKSVTKSFFMRNEPAASNHFDVWVHADKVDAVRQACAKYLPIYNLDIEIHARKTETGK